MLTILITDKDGERRREELSAEEAVIGRADDADLVLPRSSVSKKHARIARKNGRYVIADLGSTNGTYVNGRKIHGPLVLSEGDKVYLGDFILTIERAMRDEAQPPPPTTPAAGTPTLPPAAGTPAREIREALRAVALRIDAEIPSDDAEGEGALARAREAAARAIGELGRAGAISSDLDLDGLRELAAREVAGLGALEGLVTDARVRAIAVHGPNLVEVDFGHGFEPVNAAFSDAARLDRVLRRLLRQAGWDAARPLPSAVETMLPDGSRLLALRPPLAPRGPIVRLERPTPPPTKASLVERGVLDDEGFRILETLGRRGHSVALVGAEGSGADELALALAARAERDGGLVFAERAPALAQVRDDAVALVEGCLGDPPFASVLAEAARLAPERLFIDGVRGGELRAALEILASRRKGDVLGVRSAHEGRAGPPLLALASLESGSSGALELLVARAVRAAALCVATPNGPRVAAIRELRFGDDGLAEKVLWSP